MSTIVKPRCFAVTTAIATVLAIATTAFACPGDGPDATTVAASTSLGAGPLVALAAGPRPETAGWYAGDMHVHRSCGGAPVSTATLRDAMDQQDLDFASILADMGNGEVQDATADLPKVNGHDDAASTPSRVLHWDTEWHWDATYWQYPHQALGGHLVALDLQEGHQIWNESTHAIFDWAHQQGAIAGFAHMQYLDEGFPQTLNCCTPIEYPVEVALGAADFISEDVNGGESAIHAYYRLLNCGFRPGLAAGSDYPCNAQIGHLLTYARTASGTMDYHEWAQAIAKGRTVVSRNARHGFLDLRVDGTALPGDEVNLSTAGSVTVAARWTSNQALARTLELVVDGQVVASREANAGPDGADSLVTTLEFQKSGWVCARVMGEDGHELHTAAVFVLVQGAPIRASAKDARFYVRWIESLIANASPGGPWDAYYPTQWTEVRERFLAAKALYEQIAEDAALACPCSMFEHDDTPVVADVTDHTPVELGVKFRTQVDGHVTAVRFYKGAANDGPHTGHVWAATGELLGEAEFTDETASGWQNVNFATPVPVHAGVTYVASYHSTGFYADDQKYFALGVDSGPLRYLADGEDGPNGVYSYGASPSFPLESFDSSNYWVDVVFTPDDLTPPVVNAVSPTEDAIGVGTDVIVRVAFNEPIDSACVKAATFELRGPGNALVAATYHYNAADRIAELTPLQPLADSSVYTVRVHGGSVGCRIRDRAANALAADRVWSFSTTLGGVLAVDVPPARPLRLAASPNPSRGPLLLSLQSPGGGYDALELLDVSGRVVKSLTRGAATGDRWDVRWDGHDDSGRKVAPGLYFARMRSKSGTAVVRVALIP